MFLLLFFSLVVADNFEWEEVKYYDTKAITRQIKESFAVKNYGKGVLKKSLIYFDDGIFQSGDKLVIPEGAEILRLPSGLKISSTNVDIIKHDRYAVEYKEGTLRDEWEKLKRESAKKLGLSSFENLTVEQIMQIKSRVNSENQVVRKSKRVNRIVNQYPEKFYISFILIEVNGQRKLLPVVLSISPIQTLLGSAEGI